MKISGENPMQLTAISCCALQCAFKRYPETTKVFEKSASTKMIDDFKEALEDPNRHVLTFIVNADAAEVCGVLASKELERMGDVAPETKLPCEHTVKEHKEALKAIAKITEAETVIN